MSWRCIKCVGHELCSSANRLEALALVAAGVLVNAGLELAVAGVAESRVDVSLLAKPIQQCSSNDTSVTSFA